ncbi:MAG: replicative DNA helicase [Verrucomicrobiota bacterium]
MPDPHVAEITTSNAPPSTQPGAPELLKNDSSAGYTQDTHRSLPNSPDAEKMVLASMAHVPHEHISLAIEHLDPEYFYNPAHSKIFATLIELYDQGKPVDLVAVQQTLADRNELDQAGGAALLIEIFTAEPPAAHFDHHMGIIREKATLRNIISTCTGAIGSAYDAQEDVTGLLDSVESDILTIRDGQNAKESFTTLREEAYKTVEYLDEVSRDKSKALGLPTGFKDFDDMTNGLHGGEMVVIAARPSMGKTAFAMNIIEHAGVENKIPAAVFSLEMSSQQLCQRLISGRSQIDMRTLRGGLFNKSDFPKLTSIANQLAQSPIFIDDTGALTIMELRHKARRLKKMHDIKLIAVDYLQLVRSNTKRANDSRQVEVAEVSAGLKSLAKELNIPIVVLAQLNRNPDAREGGKPRISDLRESGSIEQDADVVGLLWRKAYYQDKKDDEEPPEDDNGKAELLIAKQRNGPTGIVRLTFLPKRMCFVDRAPGDDDDEEGF